MPSRRPSRQLVQLFDQSLLPIYVVDEGREIVYCNRACATWMGIESAELIGHKCVYHSGETGGLVEQAVAALCPPPQTFLGERALVPVVWRGADGLPEQRSGLFVPLGGGDRLENHVVAVLSEPVHGAPQTVVSETASSAELHERLQRLTRQMRSRFRLDRLVGESPAIRRVREQVRLAIAGRPNVLILGPAGSGREHVARTIHAADAPDSAGPLLPLDCQKLDAEAVQSSILEFLRRTQEHPGKTSTASILLLDADALSAAAQSELQAFMRVPTFTVRTIATARQPLVELAGRGSFLVELAYALSSLLIELPALCDRREDIPLLSQRFVEDFNRLGGKQLAGFAPAALDRLASLPWTGNVDELAGVVGDACRNVTAVWIGESDLPARVRAIAAAGAHPQRASESIRLDEFLEQVERELIQRAMRRARGNKAQAARLLGVSRQRLLGRLKHFGLDVPPAAEIEFQPIDDDSAD